MVPQAVIFTPLTCKGDTNFTDFHELGFESEMNKLKLLAQLVKIRISYFKNSNQIQTKTSNHLLL